MAFKDMFRKGKDHDVPMASQREPKVEEVVPVEKVVPVEPLASAGEGRPFASAGATEPVAREVAPLPMQNSVTAGVYGGPAFVPVKDAQEVEPELSSVPPVTPQPAASQWALLVFSSLLLTARTAASFVQACQQVQAHHERQMEVLMTNTERQVAQGDLQVARTSLQRRLRQAELKRLAEVRLTAALDLQERVRSAQQQALALHDLSQQDASALANQVEALAQLLDSANVDRELWQSAEMKSVGTAIASEHWNSSAAREEIEATLGRLGARPVPEAVQN